MNSSKKICPICQNENEADALVCRHCGVLLDEYRTSLVAKPELDTHTSPSASQLESFIDARLIPEDGIGIHVAGDSKPLYVSIPEEIVIGRLTEATSASESEAFLDLTSMHAATMGVSRRHVMIKRTSSGYEVTDLSSRNGTWLNAERLAPNKPYPLASGSQLRIGHMRLLIMHRLPPAK